MVYKNINYYDFFSNQAEDKWLLMICAKRASKNLAFGIGSLKMHVCKIFRKTNIFYPLIGTPTCAYEGVRNVSFSENFAYVLNRCLVMHKHFLGHKYIEEVTYDSQSRIYLLGKVDFDKF